ncbi:SprT family zinc-dependent metalloprotease [Limibacillus sp. MBR-115]|jgi:predicted metal-dependent hydrolase|uniref:M48 family metallopeptidase n=1 Tax=Limibacillus sp. MBR-115 TaxID=3156465 RepID=UPI00339488CF
MLWKSSLPESLEIDGRRLTLKVRRDTRARRLILRVDPADGGVALTIPRGTSNRTAIDFLERHEGWIAGRLHKLPPLTPFTHGAAIPILGDLHRIEHRPDARGGVWREEQVVFVTGKPEHLQRRLTDYLKGEARKVCRTRSEALAGKIGEKVTRVTVRDTRSRWGSCSTSGALSFSWRLIMAPEAVLDYVIAHEVAHLRHHDHSPSFWRLVSELVPDHQAQRRWLKREGSLLWRFG